MRLACSILILLTAPTALADLLAAEILAYEPPRRPGVSEKDYDKALFFLEETVRQTEGQVEQFNVADYWNVTVAYMLLEEPKERIERVFQAAIDDSHESVCAYTRHLGSVSFAAVIPELFARLSASCGEAEAKAPLDVAAYAETHGLDPVIVAEVDAIGRDDARYRSEDPVDWKRQGPLDLANQERITALFEEHGTYLGQSLVGPELDHVMWSVIQHSTLGMMQRFLPIVQAEVESGGLDTGPLRMLVDRVHWLEHGTQIFGSQGGVDLAEPARRREVAARWGL